MLHVTEISPELHEAAVSLPNCMTWQHGHSFKVFMHGYSKSSYHKASSSHEHEHIQSCLVSDNLSFLKKLAGNFIAVIHTRRAAELVK